MQARTVPTHPAEADTSAERRPAAAPARPRWRSRVYDLALPLRLVRVRLLNYLTNYVAAYVPSHTFRRLWYRHVLGIPVGRHTGVFMGTYVWFFSPGSNRRNGVRIGRNTRINRRCTLDLRCGLTIGDNVSISPEVMILGASHDVNDAQFSPVQHGSITIGDHAYIGTRAMILPGVSVGRGAHVVAGSMVSKDVPPLTIVAGAPARPIGMRDPAAIAYELDEPLPLFE